MINQTVVIQINLVLAVVAAVCFLCFHFFYKGSEQAKKRGSILYWVGFACILLGVLLGLLVGLDMT